MKIKSIKKTSQIDSSDFLLFEFTKMTIFMTKIWLILRVFSLLLLTINGENQSLVENDIRTFNIIDVFLKKCRLMTGIMSPSEFSGYPTVIDFAFIPLKFTDIDSVAETFALSGVLMTTFPITCGLQVNQQYPGQLPHKLWLQADILWQPVLSLENCYQSCNLQSDAYTRRAKYYSEYLKIRNYYSGKFETSCDLQLWAFPFDT